MGGLGKRLPVDRMIDQLNYEDDQEYRYRISTLETTISADLRERPPKWGCWEISGEWGDEFYGGRSILP